MELVKDQVYAIRLTDGSWTRGVFLYVKGPSFYSNRNHFIFRNHSIYNSLDRRLTCVKNQTM